MSKDFKISGNTSAEKFKQLDIILPRIARRINPENMVIIPAALTGLFSPLGQGMLFKVSLFAGRIIKICFNVERVMNGEKESSIDIRCGVGNDDIEQIMNIKTKKLSNVFNVNFKTLDGDVIKIISNDSNLIYHNISMSFLFFSDYKKKEKADERI